MVALVLAWHRLFAKALPEVLWFENDWTVGEIFRERYFPGFFLVPGSVALLLWSCYMSKYRSDATAALALIVIAWLLASYNAVERILDSFMVIGCPLPGPVGMQYNFNLELLRSVSLPLFATLPAIYCLWGRLKCPACQKAILYGSVLFALVDMLVLFYLMSSTFGIFGSYYYHYPSCF